MIDSESLQDLSDQQLQDKLMQIDRKFAGISVNNEGIAEILNFYRDSIMFEIQERQTREALKQTPLQPINLTVDDLSRSENQDETQDKEQKHFK